MKARLKVSRRRRGRTRNYSMSRSVQPYVSGFSLSAGSRIYTKLVAAPNMIIRFINIYYLTQIVLQDLLAIIIWDTTVRGVAA